MISSKARWSLIVLALASGRCAQTEPTARGSRPVSEPASGAEGQAAASTAASSAAATQPAETAAEPRSTPPAPTYDESESLESYMTEHFVIVTYARDAVITGHLGALRRALGALAEYKYEHVTAGDWQPWIAQMQEAARLGAKASTLEEAALAIAKTAAVCGQCHEARHSGPEFPAGDNPDADSGLSNTLSDRMERHVWAANRMWEGLIAPSDQFWRMGSNELASVPFKAPKQKPKLSAKFVQQLRLVREIGDQARSADEPSERVRTYARFLTTCAHCHEQELKMTF